MGVRNENWKKEYPEIPEYKLRKDGKPALTKKGKKQLNADQVWGMLWNNGIKLPKHGDRDGDGTPNFLDHRPLDNTDATYDKSKIACGNSKLHKTIGVWSIPPGVSCPGATYLCSKYCYVKKGEKQYGGYYGSMRRNRYYSEQPDFEDKMVALINRKFQKWFRIHESGDFYSQKYLEKWINIARRCPDTKFLAFTKAYHFKDGSVPVYKDVPSNLLIRFSTDASSTPEAIAFKNSNNMPETFCGYRSIKKPYSSKYCLGTEVQHKDKTKECRGKVKDGYAPDFKLSECRCNLPNGNYGCTPSTHEDYKPKGKPRTSKKRFDATCMQCWGGGDVFIEIHD